ncbi:MAG TPA: glycosyltransferase family 1 protein [Bryobacteraceae bacterium]|nr:glycosyltransferase family 1 protein [Bryobacteraceae bacterium]
MRIALDATYSVGSALSGVGVYSRELLNGLAASDFAEGWDWFYRSQKYWRARFQPAPRNVKVRRLSSKGGNRSAALFHGLNQRLPALRFRRQVATFHDLFVLSGDYSTPEFRARFAAQAREAAAAADLIIAVSAFTAMQVESYLNVPASRIRVIHHGVLARDNGGDERQREKVILCVGALQRRKNQIALVRAFQFAPPDWILVLAGSEGYEAEHVLREIANSPVVDRIRITGYISDEEIAKWYRRASIFAFPSLDEGFGMPVIEAMAAGVPVIASNRSSLPEVCGDAAMLVDPRSDGELAEAVGILTRDEELRAKLTAAGKVRATGFRWDEAVRQTIAVYREIIGG